MHYNYYYFSESCHTGSECHTGLPTQDTQIATQACPHRTLKLPHRLNFDVAPCSTKRELTKRMPSVTVHANLRNSRYRKLKKRISIASQEAVSNISEQKLLSDIGRYTMQLSHTPVILCTIVTSVSTVQLNAPEMSLACT